MTKDSVTNPFNITKAVDFSDQQINDYWVDIPEAGGFLKLAKPTSPMPMLILGGKGSGKTHLMRYFSYQLQKIRHQEDVVAGLCSDNYLGIYLRCGGLNAARFEGKGQPDDAWVTVFAYYMEIWLSQLVLDIVADAFVASPELASSERRIVDDLVALFDHFPGARPTSLREVRAALGSLQRQLDTAVNNCAISRTLTVEICATRGKLVFGIPRTLAKHLPSVGSCLFVYLIDEFENLSEPQQKYINTLIREKESPCSFKIGAKLYGVRTLATYSADEENKEGSEFERLPLDARLRGNEEKYKLFAMRLVAKRLREAGYLSSTPNAEDELASRLDAFFERVPASPFGEEETRFVLSKFAGSDRPYFVTLKAKLEAGRRAGTAPGVSTDGAVSEVIEILAFPSLPLLEKVNIFLLYKDWVSKKDLPDSARAIRAECERYVARSRPTPKRYNEVMLHFRADLLAQLYRECGGNQKQRYTGISTFIDMSWGIPRNLLILLKHVFAWAVFNGEKPFEDKLISLKAQESGMNEAAEWFYRDAKKIGADGAALQNAIGRLGELFKGIRFSDKPSECSCSAFSADVSQASDHAQRLIDTAVKWSLLIDVGDQHDRNTSRVDLKFQLNRMLAPRWDLAIYRRGVLALTPAELNAIFDPALRDGFKELLERRVARMTAPGFGKKTTKVKKEESITDVLPGF